MKKVLSLLAVLFLFAGLSFAAPVVNSYKAFVNFSDSGESLFSFDIYEGNTQITNPDDMVIKWSSSTTYNTSTTTVWGIAQRYAVIKATATKSNFRVCLYQDNKNGTNYKAVAGRIEERGDGANKYQVEVYSGLVDKTEGKKYIPVAYSMFKTRQNNPTYDIKTATVTADRSDRFFTDKSDKKVNGETEFDESYGIIAGNYGPNWTEFGGPIFANGADGYWGNGVDGYGEAYVYFFGGFSSIKNREYGTDKLYIEQKFE